MTKIARRSHRSIDVRRALLWRVTADVVSWLVIIALAPTIGGAAFMLYTRSTSQMPTVVICGFVAGVLYLCQRIAEHDVEHVYTKRLNGRTFHFIKEA